MRRFTTTQLAIAAAVLAACVVAGTGTWFATKQQGASFLDSAMVRVVRTPGGMLEVSEIQRVEEFGWQSQHACPLIDCAKLLGSTVSRIRAPTHYVYRIPLAETWQLVPKGDHYELIVPAPQLKTPVAFETSKIELETQRNWFSPPTQPNEKAVLKQLGPELARRGVQASYLALQQPHAERTVAEFAQKWMREQSQGIDKPIKVRFVDSRAH